MNVIISLFFPVAIILVFISLSSALECYVCEKQEDNKEKCATTIKTCQQEEDVCLTEVSWGSTPYWTIGAKKQFYISKTCSSKERCHRQRASSWTYCTHIWYEDWRCTDCCRGDRCNYYIFSNSGQLRVSKIILSLSTLFVLYKYF